MIKYRVIKVVNRLTNTVAYKTEHVVWQELYYKLYDSVEDAMQAIKEFKKQTYRPSEVVVYEEA